MPNSVPRAAVARGFSLVEVMVAVFVLAVGALGVSAMQLVSLRNAESSYERSQAVEQTYAILDSMRANLDAARAGGYNLSRTCSAPDAGSLIANDQRQWLLALHETLGAASCGTIDCVSSICTITVEWNDARATEGSSAQTMTTRSRL